MITKEERLSGVEQSLEGLLDALGFDWRSDPNMDRTPHRVAKMYVNELFKGVYTDRPLLADFPNTEQCDELFAVGPIPVNSVCSHHFAPIQGSVWIGVIPGERLLGLSKYSRLTDWIMSRPTLQEDACVRLANEVEQVISPKGLGVVMKSSHSCMSMRGVKNENGLMTTSIMRGVLRESTAARAEFMSMIRGMGF